MRKVIAVIVFTMAIAGATFAQTDRIGGQHWKLVELGGMNVGLASGAYLELSRDQTRFSGNTGCNRMFGAVDLQGGRRIDFPNVGMTRMACVEVRARRVETELVKALENADRFRTRANSLELLDRNRIVARFTAPTKLPPNSGGSDLESSKWTLEALKGVPVSRVGRTAFVVFDGNKRTAGGNSSCNVFGGSYTSVGKTIKVTEIVSTMRACEEENRMKIEREFLNGLERADRYETRAGKLMLYRNNRLLLTLAGERK